jgi:hypothetical protein
LLLLQEKKVQGKNNDLRPLQLAVNKQNSQPPNWLSRHVNQDYDDASGFPLLVWDMKQMLVAIVTGKEGSAREVVL